MLPDDITPEERQFQEEMWESIKDMCQHTGWKHTSEKYENLLQAYRDRLETDLNEHDTGKIRGAIRVIRELLAIETIADHELDAINEPLGEDEDDAYL